MKKTPEKNIAQQLLEQYIDAYKQRDLSKILSLFTQDCTLWGTAIDEYRVGLKELESQHNRDWQQSTQAEIQVVSFVPTPYDLPFAAAICRAIVTINGEKNVFEDLRGSIVIKEEEDNVWKIFHMHASFPDYRNHENSSFPTQ